MNVFFCVTEKNTQSNSFGSLKQGHGPVKKNSNDPALWYIIILIIIITTQSTDAICSNQTGI